MIVKAGSTDVTTYFVLRTAADGTATTGATITNIDLQYVRSGAAPAAKVDATALAATDSAHGDNKAIEIDATGADGLYRVDWPDAAFAAGVPEVILSVKLASSFTEHLRVELSPPVDVQAVDGDETAAANLNSACDNYSATRGLSGTALPAAAADAAGGLPISDAGELDIDAKLANTNEVTAARMGALTDWINGGRLDLLLDAIPTTAMRGTDSAALASVCTEGRLAELDAANLPADVDTLLGRITTTLFSGITSLAEWLGLIAGEQAGDATALTEVKATGAGSGTYDPTTDSNEAIAGAGGGGAPTVEQIRAEMDSNSTQLAAIVADTNELQTNQGNWATITAGAIRTAVGLASASLDTQLLAIWEDTTAVADDWAEDGRLDVILDAIPTTAMRGTDSAALASVCTEGRLAELDAGNLPADVAAVKTDTGNLVTRITATLFSGITSLANWMRLLARSDAAIGTDASTELGEINNDEGSGAGNFDQATDSQEHVGHLVDGAFEETP